MAREHAMSRLFASTLSPTLWRPAVLAPITVLVCLVAVVLVGGILTPGFLTSTNLFNILSLATYLGVAAIGQTIVMLTGGIDLSLAWTITGASVIFTGITQGDDARVLVGVAGALAASLAVGFVNGVGIAKLGISPIVMTLGMNNVMQGITLIYCGGTPSGTATDSVKVIASGSIGPIPIILLVWIALAIVVSVGLHATRWGRYLYSVGESPRVSYLSGIDNDLVIILAYGLCGLSGGIAGILFTGFSTMSFLGMGDQFVLPAIAAVVLGGTSIFGGRGGYLGSFVGAVFITALTTVLAIVNIPVGYRSIIYGLVIIAAVLLYRVYSRERE
jgi:ribose transport system permease protein